MTRITIVIDGPASGQVSEQISSMLFAAVAQNDVTLRKFEMDELRTVPGYRENSTQIQIPEFLQKRDRTTTG